jgi:ketosteroid isomerase-like protein
MPDKYVGLYAVYKFMQETIVSQFADSAVSNLLIQQIAGSNSCVGEYELRATIKSTGKVYNPKYIILLTAKDGKITYLKEYVNPLSITAAFNK